MVHLHLHCEAHYNVDTDMHTNQDATEVRVYILECLLMSYQVCPNGGLTKKIHKDCRREASYDYRWSTTIYVLTEKLLMEFFYIRRRGEDIRKLEN